MEIIKRVYRLFYYKSEWRKQFRELKIRKLQRATLKNIDSKTENLIIFFIPGASYYSGKEIITGGLISIISLAEETSRIFRNNSHFKIVCSTYYDTHLLFKIKSFDNQTDIFNPGLIERHFTNVKNLIMHIPELYVENFVSNQLSNKWLNNVPAVQINVLNQNIDLMPHVKVISALRLHFPNCTITTAHKKYCNVAFREKYGLPLHQLSVWISPENYNKLKFEEKENLILFSPDNKDFSQRMINYFIKKLPDYSFRIIQGLNYNEYKELIAKSKFLITFGEGLDAYFIETYFSGGIAFAIKNLNFFDNKFLDLPCLFEVEENLELKLLSLIENYSNIESYISLNNTVFELLRMDYSYTVYQRNLENFYKKDFTHA